jgi:hypothetical protein
MCSIPSVTQQRQTGRVRDAGQFVVQGQASWIASITSVLKFSFDRSGRASMYAITARTMCSSFTLLDEAFMQAHLPAQGHVVFVCSAISKWLLLLTLHLILFGQLYPR